MAALWCSSTSLAFSPHSILSRDHIMPARSSEPKDHSLHRRNFAGVERGGVGSQQKSFHGDTLFSVTCNWRNSWKTVFLGSRAEQWESTLWLTPTHSVRLHRFIIP
jgi:hypothetical protein